VLPHIERHTQGRQPAADAQAHLGQPPGRGATERLQLQAGLGVRVNLEHAQEVAQRGGAVLGAQRPFIELAARRLSPGGFVELKLGQRHIDATLRTLKPLLGQPQPALAARGLHDVMVPESGRRSAAEHDDAQLRGLGIEPPQTPAAGWGDRRAIRPVLRCACHGARRCGAGPRRAAAARQHGGPQQRAPSQGAAGKSPAQTIWNFSGCR
jgi:hypothetical protein